MTYSSSASMTRRTYARRNQNVVSYAESAKTIGPVSNTIILLVLACLIGLLYLTQVTKTNSYGYKIDDLEKQALSLKHEKSDLEVSAARLESLDRVKNSAASKSLVSVAPTATINN